MKKLLLLLVALFVTGILMSQNVNLGNFENNSISPWYGWSGNVSVQPNPNTSGNLSNYAGELIVPSGWSGGIARWDNASVLDPSHIKLTLDVYFLGTGTTTFKLQMDNSISGKANTEKYQNVTANTWTSLEFDLVGIAGYDYKQIAFQSGTAGRIYIDNVMLIQGVPVDKVLATFESTLEGWGPWAPATAAQFANPNTTGNASGGVARYDQTGNTWKALAKWIDPPVFNAIYEKMSIDVYYPTATSRFQLWLGNSIGGTANYTSYTDAIPVGAWTTVEFDLTGLPALDYRNVAFQSGLDGVMYLDNIVLKVAESSPPPTPSVIKPNAWINEIHYDNIGADVNEFVEVVIEKPYLYDLAQISVVLYNGADRKMYNATTLNNFTVGEVDTAFTVYHYMYPPEKLVNDLGGIALVYRDTILVQFLSYEGTFTAIDGPALGTLSKDIGVAQINYPVGNSLQLEGLGDVYYYFYWIDPPASPGLINVTQTLQAPVVVPVNWKYIAGFFIALMAFAIIRRFW